MCVQQTCMTRDSDLDFESHFWPTQTRVMIDNDSIGLGLGFHPSDSDLGLGLDGKMPNIHYFKTLKHRKFLAT